MTPKEIEKLLPPTIRTKKHDFRSVDASYWDCFTLMHIMALPSHFRPGRSLEGLWLVCVVQDEYDMLTRIDQETIGL